MLKLPSDLVVASYQRFLDNCIRDIVHISVNQNGICQELWNTDTIQSAQLFTVKYRERQHPLHIISISISI